MRTHTGIYYINLPTRCRQKSLKHTLKWISIFCIVLELLYEKVKWLTVCSSAILCDCTYKLHTFFSFLFEPWATPGSNSDNCQVKRINEPMKAHQGVLSDGHQAGIPTLWFTREIASGLNTTPAKSSGRKTIVTKVTIVTIVTIVTTSIITIVTIFTYIYIYLLYVIYIVTIDSIITNCY